MFRKRGIRADTFRSFCPLIKNHDCSDAWEKKNLSQTLQRSNLLANPALNMQNIHTHHKFLTWQTPVAGLIKKNGLVFSDVFLSSWRSERSFLCSSIAAWRFSRVKKPDPRPTHFCVRQKWPVPKSSRGKRSWHITLNITCSCSHTLMQRRQTPE